MQTKIMNMPWVWSTAALVLACNVALSSPLSESQCALLAGKKIPAAAIGLPTHGAVVSTGQWTDGYCLVSGKIMPVDPKATNIEFQVALPQNWNSKVVMFGGGGFDGVIPKVSGNYATPPPNAPTPLARGYAVFAGDSGHQATTPPGKLSLSLEDAAFFSNPETYRNYIGDALKKTRDSALIVVKAAYGHSPERAYFFGGSKGGQEALAVTGRWPGDWDGVVALYPARNYTLTMLGALRVSQGFAAPGAYINIAKRGALYQAALAACDSLDGVKDGVISNTQACRAAFDPVTAMLAGVPLRCADGSDTGDNCLSDAQLSALKNAETPFAFDYLEGGAQNSFLGYNVITSDLGNSSNSPVEPALMGMTIGATPPEFPIAQGNSYAAIVSDYFFRLAVANNIGFNQLTLNLHNPGPLAARLNELYALDQVDTDLTPFQKRGGKLLIMQGTDDILISARSTAAYVKNLRAKMGADKADVFLRYYEVPGFGHSLSSIFTAAWDQLAAIESWVEKGVDPANNQIVTDMVGVPGRTRPLCPYPTWPKYRGSGDANAAASFSCAAE